MPVSSEELRAKLKLECNTMLMLAALFRDKPWFTNLSAKVYQQYVDFLLGDQIFQLQIPKGDGSSQTMAASPSWDLMINFEHKLRKEAYRRTLREGKALTTSSAEVMADANFKKTYFVTPLTLELARPNNPRPGQAMVSGREETLEATRAGRRKRKVQEGQAGGQLHNAGFVYSTTPDGRQICYGFNTTCNIGKEDEDVDMASLEEEEVGHETATGEEVDSFHGKLEGTLATKAPKFPEREFIDKLANLVQKFAHEVIPDTQKAFFALALGKLQAAPFSEEQMQGLRQRPKGKTRRYDESQFSADNSNYESAKEHAQQIGIQFEEEERLGFMFPLGEKGGPAFWRSNEGKLEFPGPEASAAVMEESLDSGYHFMIAVAADIALAHRRFKHRKEDVGLLGCRVEEGGPIWFNQVGTFGVACAAYYFARLASLLGRLVMRLGGQSHTFQLLFADDLKLVAAGAQIQGGECVWSLSVSTWTMPSLRWASQSGDQGSCLVAGNLEITVAELLASLVALEVFGFLAGGGRPRQVMVEAGTDNISTEFISRKGASNKFPLIHVQLQLGLKCYLHGLVFKLHWRPREVNVEADALTILEFE
eukprot:s2321_g14.t1